jgi:hypothetical protein
MRDDEPDRPRAWLAAWIGELQKIGDRNAADRTRRVYDPLAHVRDKPLARVVPLRPRHPRTRRHLRLVDG